MCLFFNLCYFPFWLITSVVIAYVKFDHLNYLYQFILVTLLFFSTIIEIIRLYLGYLGNLTEKVPVIYFVSGQGRGGQHIYILIVECVRKDWTVGCKLKERVFISFSNLNLLLLQVLHSTTILDTSFFPCLISTKTEDPILNYFQLSQKEEIY